MLEGIIFESPEYDVYSQMAADEALCGCMDAEYILRFFRWHGQGITYGYSQRRAQVEAAAAMHGKALPDMARRPTGGGIVFHEDDVTFSFIFPSPEILFEPHKAYSRIHGAINRKYRECGEDFALSSEQTKDYSVNSPAMACFSKPVSLDILYNGKKVLGGALRKLGTRMLYQGSFQFPAARQRQYYHRRVITEALGEEFGLCWTVKDFSPDLIEKTKNLTEEKYTTEKWNFRI
ncbi:MAG: lipoate--protein ligase family protein [Elusimicrobiales bacterium]|nr:lipoate--protein ligase family protein [Elusimicrobiales bacterium]